MQVEQVCVKRNGLAGDWQEDRKHHGGPDRAICMYALERIEALQEEGHPVFPGATGENIVTSGLPWDEVRPNVKLQIGKKVLLEVSDYTSPCKTIAAVFIAGDFSRISQKIHPGWSRVYLRVLKEGSIRVGDSIKLIS